MVNVTAAEEFAESYAIFALAGRSAERRAARGSEPGWKKRLSQIEHVAFHEAGHCVVGIALGIEIELVTIVPDTDKRVGRNGYVGGFVQPVSTKPEDLPSQNLASLGLTMPMEVVQEAKTWTDEQHAVRIAFLLCESSRDWRSMRRVLMVLRTRARRLVDEHYQNAIMPLASHLLRRRTLEKSEIYEILRHMVSRPGASPVDQLEFKSANS